MKRRNYAKKISIYLLIFVMLISSIIIVKSEEIYGADDREITICIELFSLGNGYLVEPARVKVGQNETLADVLVRTILDNGYCCYFGGTTKSAFYLSYIADGDKTNKKYDGYNRSDSPHSISKLNIHTNISDELSEHLNADMNYFYPNDFEDNYKNILGEFVYTNGSGWMYCVNNEFPSLAFSQYIPKNGDVVRVQFTLCYGADIGGASAMGDDSEIYGTLSENYYDVANKDKLTELVADINTNYKSAITSAALSLNYKNAINVLTNVRSAQTQADSAYSSLKSAFESYKANIAKQQTSKNTASDTNSSSNNGTGNNSNTGNGTGNNSNTGNETGAGKTPSNNTQGSSHLSGYTGTGDITGTADGNKGGLNIDKSTGEENGEIKDGTDNTKDDGEDGTDNIKDSEETQNTVNITGSDMTNSELSKDEASNTTDILNNRNENLIESRAGNKTDNVLKNIIPVIIVVAVVAVVTIFIYRKEKGKEKNNEEKFNS